MWKFSCPANTLKMKLILSAQQVILTTFRNFAKDTFEKWQPSDYSDWYESLMQSGKPTMS
tara:strand:- start:272 stop:451 length:180 start_codon:yes stop_codon:yes gene_type:complete